MPTNFRDVMLLLMKRGSITTYLKRNNSQKCGLDPTTRFKPPKKTKLIELRYKLLPHPPYSPVLSPCDFPAIELEELAWRNFFFIERAGYRRDE